MFRWCSGNILAFHLEIAWPAGSIPARYNVFLHFWDRRNALFDEADLILWSAIFLVEVWSSYAFSWLEASGARLDRPWVYQRAVGLRGVGVGLSVNDTVASVWLGSMYDMLDLIMQPFVICSRTAFRFCYTPSLIRGSLVLYTLFFWRLNSNRWDCVLYTRCSGEDEMKHLRLSRHFAPNVGAVDERL
jgi:hypothetical protein